MNECVVSDECGEMLKCKGVSKVITDPKWVCVLSIYYLKYQCVPSKVCVISKVSMCINKGVCVCVCVQ